MLRIAIGGALGNQVKPGFGAGKSRKGPRDRAHITLDDYSQVWPSQRLGDAVRVLYLENYDMALACQLLLRCGSLGKHAAEAAGGLGHQRWNQLSVEGPAASILNHPPSLLVDS